MARFWFFFLTFPASIFAATWNEDPFWEGGKAEILVYDVKLSREGALRKGEVVEILVKEDHDPNTSVKAEDWHRPGLKSRIKFNEVVDVPTGTYSYHQMLTIFFDKTDLSIPKIVFSSQDWCGQTLKEIRVGSGEAILNFNSYWEGEAKSSRNLKWPKEIVPYNALPVLLRSMVQKGEKSAHFPLFSDLISNKVGKTETSEATAQLEETGQIVVEWKEGGETVRDRFWFAADGLRHLMRWERHDGGVYQLKKRTVDNYWTRNR